MKISSVLLLVIGAILLLTCTVSAIEVPNVALPTISDTQVISTDSPTVDLYRPHPYCVECMPEPTPAPVYETIGLSVSCPTTKVRQNKPVTFMATQISGTPVLSTASWDWIIQSPKKAFQAKGSTATVTAQYFGRYHINLNVRDSVQMLNGHVTTDFTITEKR